MTDFMPSQEQRGEPTVTSLKAELAPASEDFRQACHALDEAHGMLWDARAELAALKARLAGLSAKWKAESGEMGEFVRRQMTYGTVDHTWLIGQCATDLDAVLKENNDE